MSILFAISPSAFFVFTWGLLFLGISTPNEIVEISTIALVILLVIKSRWQLSKALTITFYVGTHLLSSIIVGSALFYFSQSSFN